MYMFSSPSLKSLVMKKLNEKIDSYQKSLDASLAEMKVNRSLSLSRAFDEYLSDVEQVNKDYKYNKEKVVETHVNNLLNKII